MCCCILKFGKVKVKKYQTVELNVEKYYIYKFKIVN